MSIRPAFLPKKSGWCPGLDGNLSTAATESPRRLKRDTKIPRSRVALVRRAANLKNRIYRSPIIH